MTTDVAYSADQLLLSPDGGRMYVPTQDPCAIFVIDTSNGAGVARIGLPTFGNNWGGFDYESGEEAAIPHEDDENDEDDTHRAHHASFALSGSQLLVSTEYRYNINGYHPGVCVIDIGTLTVAKTFPPPWRATEIARPVVGQDGKRAFLLSMNWPAGDSMVTFIDIRRKAKQPGQLCVNEMWPALPVLSPDDQRLYVNGRKDWDRSDPGVFAFDTTTCDLAATVENVDCWELMVSVDGTRLYCVVVAEDNAGSEGIIVIDAIGCRVQRVIEFELPAPARDLGEGYVASPA